MCEKGTFSKCSQSFLCMHMYNIRIQRKWQKMLIKSLPDMEKLQRRSVATYIADHPFGLNARLLP